MKSLEVASFIFNIGNHMLKNLLFIRLIKAFVCQACDPYILSSNLEGAFVVTYY